MAAPKKKFVRSGRIEIVTFPELVNELTKFRGQRSLSNYCEEVLIKHVRFMQTKDERYGKTQQNNGLTPAKTVLGKKTENRGDTTIVYD